VERLVGLDYFGARYFSAAQGRFTSPDPLWIKIDRLLDPQRLNLYAYGRNNPLKFGDPTGMDVVLGKCAGGDTQKCFGEVLRTVPEKDRAHIHLVTGDGKSGVSEGPIRHHRGQGLQECVRQLQYLADGGK
jgi:RHS repeat-associated protein